MAAQAGLCLAWSETPEDTFCHVLAQLCFCREIQKISNGSLECHRELISTALLPPKGADRMRNSIDPEQTALSVLSGSWPGAVARSDVHPPHMRMAVGSILTSGNILIWRLDMN